MSEKQRLYRVVTRGLGDHYVVALDPTSAYQTIRDWFDANNYGIDSKRQMDRVELIAETGHYPEAPNRLWITEGLS